ncbi:MAG TPA: AMP-binding protein [Candidatus Binatia bacterium]
MAILENWPVDHGYLAIPRSLAVNARRFPDKVAIHDIKDSITYRELNSKVNRLAHGLGELGVGKGNHVALLFGNTIDHVAALYAVARAGAAAVVLDLKWKGREVLQALKAFDCDLLLYDGAFSSAVPPETLQVLKFGGYDLAAGDCPLIADQPDAPFPSPTRDEDLFMIMLTAGTTGTPKGCMVNHRTYAVQCMNSAIGRGCSESSKELSVVPIYYNSGRSTVIAHLFFGGTVYLRERFDARETLELIQREKISSLGLASTMCHRLLQLPDLEKYDLSSIRALRKAGLPFTRKMVEELIARVTPNIYQGYASTDAGQATFLRPDEQLAKIGSSGRAIWGAEVEVVDGNHEPLPGGKDGEIRVRGPNVCQGYYKNPEEQAKRFIDGWYYTGDIGRFDEDGYLYVVGRIKDIIKTGSINVAPKEVEEVLLFHPGIADAAVVGVSDPEWGELIQAYVVARPAHNLDEAQLIKFAREYLADYKVPKRICFVADLQRNELGKLAAGKLNELR